MDIIQTLAQELDKKPQYVENVVRLLDEGNTIPFIARYRKELHGAMDDTSLRTLEERLQYLRGLEERREAVKNAIEEQGKLTAELTAAIDRAKTLAEVEDLYRPYKQKRRTRATAAKEKGLEPLAALLFAQERDCPRPEELMGYELQRGQVVANTQAMLEGHLVNNVLLFGDGGTGKSATVKSMLFRPGFGDLRLIEVQKEGLAQMPRLIRSLAGRRQKFILFIDDLAFDQDDNTYSIMKTILEGGLERRPANVAIYATSNRRHLVRQSFSDRAGDEVDAFETISEKTALAERFGLRIPYLTMSKADYLALVDHLAARAGVAMSAELLHAQAMTWEIRHAGRTPRTAQQFIASLSLQEKQ